MASPTSAASATNAADELTKDELKRGAKNLIRKIKKYRPKIVAILGVHSYRVAFDKKNAKIGRREEMIGGSVIWILPNPSGLDGRFIPSKLKELFQELKRASDELA